MIIGLNGNKGSGKDTVGAFLVKNYGFQQLSFAKALKESAAALFGIKKEKWEEWKNDPEVRVQIRKEDESPFVLLHADISAREFLQRYGTESHRDVFGEAFWVDFVLEQALDPDGKYVVTDARFDNELLAIKDFQGINIRVERFSTEPVDNHVSEAYPDFALIDWHLDNNGSFDHLYAGVDAIMGELSVERSSAHT